MNFITWNVKSLNHPVKRKKVLSHLSQLNVGIAFLQETHLRLCDQSRLRGTWIGQLYHSNFNSKSRGTAILINKNVPFVMSKVEADSHGRFVIVTGRLYETPIILANIYAPNWDDEAFFSSFFSRLPDINSHYLLLAGDLNCALSHLDRSSTRVIPQTKVCQTIQLFLQTYGVTDVWRFENPTSRCYSFFSHVHKTFSRIDYFLMDNRLLPIVKKCEYEAIIISDHAPLLMTLDMPTSQDSYRPWRLNNLWLSDECFVQFISSEISTFMEHNETPGMSSSTIWESMKAYLRGQIISYCAQKKKGEVAHLKKLTEDILHVDMSLAQTPSPDLYKQRLMLQTEFNLLSTKHITNLLNKTYHKIYEHGEKIGTTLAHQLRQRSAAQNITEINDESGTKHINHFQINQTFFKFYSRLYTSESRQDNNLFKSFFDKLDIPSVQKQVASDLDEPFTEEEFYCAVKSMQNGKCPGPDGFPSEFFKKFGKELAPLLLSVFQESFETGALPPTMRQAVISLIPKKDKDPLECGSYRPISLLNVDNKILAKMLALRLERILPALISEDQTGFIKNRQLSSNIRRLLNILYDPTPPKGKEVLIALDAEKAFDRVEMDYLFYILKCFGFGPRFIQWIKVLYFLPMAAVRTNNNLSPFFNLQRGTRQGCPLSPLLFALTIEPLAIALRSNTDIKGILRGGAEHKVSLYADDMLIYMSDPAESLPKMLELLNSFGRISGYKVNMQKSELMPIDPSCQLSTNQSFSIKICTHKFKYLGIWITRRFKDLYEANFPPLLKQLKTDLNRWNLLSLSLGGRINVVKMNVMPRFLFIFQCLPIFLTKSFFINLNKLLSGFIWNGKTPRIRKEMLQRHKVHGGFSLPNFQYYYWSANIKNILFWTHSTTHESAPRWLQLENASCKQASLHAIACSKIPLTEPISKFCSNPIVKHSFKIWAQFRRAFSLFEMSKNAPLVGNNMFAPSINDNAFKVWSERGLRTIQDLYVGGTFGSFEHFKTHFDIPNSHFYRYLQLRSFVSTHTPSFPSLQTDSLLDKLIKIPPHFKETIGSVYSILKTSNLEPLTSLKNKWEEELGTNISDLEWQSTLKNIHSSSICLRHSVIQFKIIHRLHWSKTRLAKIMPDIDPTCDRCEVEPATLEHMFWSCPKLSDFWNSVFVFLSKALNVDIEPSPFVGIFGVVPEELGIGSYGKTVIAFTTLIARRIILMKWKDKSPPAFKHWINDVMHYLILEQIRYHIQGNSLKFCYIWQPVLTLVEKMDSNDVAIM